jgi:hypothetical protein
VRLREYQTVFATNVGKLLLWCAEQKYDVTFGETQRDPAWQKQLCEAGKSTLLFGYHNARLAVDLNLFRDGALATHTSEYEPLGIFWESLDPLNKWGGRWTDFPDSDHFQMSAPGVTIEKWEA